MIGDRADIAAVVAGVGGPVAVMSTPDLPSLHELERLGVARFTWGSGLARSAIAAAVEVARDALAR
jgi:2-methylisocitrate lyase-like PEP mutase family enzyme